MLTAASLGLLLAALGCLVVVAYPALATPLDRPARARALAIVGTYGLCVDYALVLLSPNLGVAFLAGAALAVASLAWVVLRDRRWVAQAFGIGAWCVAAVLLVGALIGARALLEPLEAWDARSMWFFHGRFVYFAGGVLRDAGWSLPAYDFSRPDDPELVPVLAGEVARAAGYWNEQLPKLALLFLLVPSLLGGAALFGRSAVALLAFVVLVVAFPGELLWNGYMDGYFALDATLAALFLERWLDAGDDADAVAGLGFLGVVAGLKHEANLLFLALAATLVLYCLWRRKFPIFPRRPADWVGLAIAAFIAFAGFLLWTAIRTQWGLENDLQIGHGLLPRALGRLAQPGDLVTIVGQMAIRSGFWRAAIIGLAAMALAGVVARALLARMAFPLLLGTIYGAGLFVVYLATPNDLHWHLQVSASRTMVTVGTLWIAPMLLLIDHVAGGGIATVRTAPPR